MAEIDLQPTEEMASNAARGLELREKHGRGGTAVGVARARDIKNRKNLSPETVRRMHAFFSRHEKNKAGGEDDAGYIAWLLWGGDSGQSWAKRKVEQMEKETNEMSETYKTIAQRLGSAARNDRPGAKARMGKASDALNYIKSSIASGKTVYVSAGHHITKVTPEAYAKWEASGRPLFKLGSKGSLLMASGSSYIALSMGDDIMLAGIKAFSRPGAKAEMANHIRTVAKDKEASRRGLRRMIDQLESEWQSLNNQPSKAGRIPRMETIKKQIAGLEDRLKSLSSRPGAKARMGKEYVLWGLPKGETDRLHEQVLSTQAKTPAEMDAIKRKAAAAGWHSFRVQILDLSKPYKGFGFSRPGAKAKFAFKVGDRVAYKPYPAQTAGELIEIRKPTRLEGVEMQYGIKQKSGAIMWVPEGMLVRASRPGAKVANAVREGEKEKFAFKVGDRVHAGFGVAGGAGVIGTITKIEDGYAHIQGDASALDRYGPKTYKSRLDRLTAPPKKAWESSKNAVREGEKVSASDDAVSRKIRKLMDEGKPQKQAVAIALDLERRGEL